MAQLPWKHDQQYAADETSTARADGMEQTTVALRDQAAPLRFEQSLTSYSLGDGHLARVWRVYDYVSPLSRQRIEEFYALPFDLRLALYWEKIDDFWARQSLEHQSAMLRGQQHFDASRGRGWAASSQRPPSKASMSPGGIWTDPSGSPSSTSPYWCSSPATARLSWTDNRRSWI